MTKTLQTAMEVLGELPEDVLQSALRIILANAALDDHDA